MLREMVKASEHGSGTNLTDGVDPVSAGREMHELITELYPICRSITGDGVRRTLARVGDVLPLEINEVPTGTPVYDWIVPPEWNIRDAWVRNANGERVIDFRKSNLHVVGYSVPVHRQRLGLDELRQHLHTLPDHPDWIPYRTSYYREAWGFCLSHRQLQELDDDEYEVDIDSSLTEGSLTYGECHVAGATQETVLISSHICHPSLANDNLSGIAVATFVARHLLGKQLRYSYRFVFAPATIGAITWLARNEDRVRHIRHGLVLAGVGGPGHHCYKRSRRGDAEIDRAMGHVLWHAGKDHRLLDFSPWGYDERQYCSPGFDLPVGSLMRTPHGEYPEYHTSADDLRFVRAEQLGESLRLCTQLVDVLENNRRYANRLPRGEPHLGKRGLYPQAGPAGSEQLPLLWVLNLSDGNHDLLAIAERSGLPFEAVLQAARLLVDKELIAPADPAEWRQRPMPS